MYRILNSKLLEKYYKEKTPIISFGKKYYAVKARTCDNCFFKKYSIYGYDIIGCKFFKTKIKCAKHVPNGICIPIRNENNLSECRADEMESIIESNFLTRYTMEVNK